MRWSISPFRLLPSNCMWRRILEFAGEAHCGGEQRSQVTGQKLEIRNQGLAGDEVKRRSA